MTLYVDASALLKVYLDQPESDDAAAILNSDRFHATSRLTLVEVRRNLARGLDGRRLSQAKRRFGQQWGEFDVVELGQDVCDKAVQIAERTRVRTLDALHLAAALSLRPTPSFVTYDIRQAKAARSLGLEVLGV